MRRKPEIEPPHINLDPRAEMEAFDKLPKRVRAALNDGPVKYVGLAGGGIAVSVHQLGVDQAAKLIRAGKVPGCVEVKIPGMNGSLED